MIRTYGDAHRSPRFGNLLLDGCYDVFEVNPNFFCNSLIGAEAPNVSMPML
jgi:hypothetical protein